MTARLRRVHPATLIALLALFVAVGGPAEAARLINGKTIRKGTVRGRQIKDRSLTTRDLSVGTRRSLRATPAGSVGASQIRNGAVSLDKLAPNSVTGNQVFDHSLSAVDLLHDTLSAAEIAPNAITNSEIATNAVTKSDIATGAVGQAEIGAAAVGTGEIIDGDLHATDLGAFAGKVNGDFAIVVAGTCQVKDFPVAPQHAGQDLTTDLVVVGTPASLPDNLVATGKAAGATSLRLQICNPTATDSAELPALDFPYVAIAP